MYADQVGVIHTFPSLTVVDKHSSFFFCLLTKRPMDIVNLHHPSVQSGNLHCPNSVLVPINQIPSDSERGKKKLSGKKVKKVWKSRKMSVVAMVHSGFFNPGQPSHFAHGNSCLPGTVTSANRVSGTWRQLTDDYYYLQCDLSRHLFRGASQPAARRLVEFDLLSPCI